MEYIYGIYKEYIRNIHKDLWYKVIRNTGAAFGGAPIGRPLSAAAPLGLCFWSFNIIDIYGYSLYIPYIFHIYFLAMFHIFSLVCFLIYGVKRRQVLIAKSRFYFIFQFLYILYFYSQFYDCSSKLMFF